MSRTDRERKAFEEMIEGKPIPLATLSRMALTATLDPFRLLVSHMPGPLGYGLRRIFFRRVFGELGENCILDVGLRIVGGENVSVGSYTWIDAYVSLSALFGRLTIGKRIHIAPSSIILAGEEGIEIGDYVAIGAGTQIYGHSETARNGKRMSGPMVPWRFKSYRSARVVVQRDAFIGAGTIILPGCTIGEGAVVGAGSVITRDVEPWSIVFGNPIRVVGRRDPVTVPEI